MKKTKLKGRIGKQSNPSSEKQSGNSTASVLNPSEKNPRTISQERLALLKRQLAEFGDLSGIVHNVRTHELVAGHQRVKHLSEGEIQIAQTYSPPTGIGTVAEGWINVKGERFTFRQVDWPIEKARKAMLAANNPAGVWERDLLAELIAQIAPEDIDMTGFGGQALTELLGKDDEENDDNDDAACDYPIVPRVLESYKYVVIIADNLLDFTALCEWFPVKQSMNENGYRMPGRVIWCREFFAALERFRAKVVKNGEDNHSE